MDIKFENIKRKASSVNMAEVNAKTAKEVLENGLDGKRVSFSDEDKEKVLNAKQNEIVGFIATDDKSFWFVNYDYAKNNYEINNENDKTDKTEIKFENIKRKASSVNMAEVNAKTAKEVLENGLDGKRVSFSDEDKEDVLNAKDNEVVGFIATDDESFWFVNYDYAKNNYEINNENVDLTEEEREVFEALKENLATYYSSINKKVSLDNIKNMDELNKAYKNAIDEVIEYNEKFNDLKKEIIINENKEELVEVLKKHLSSSNKINYDKLIKPEKIDEEFEIDDELEFEMLRLRILGMVLEEVKEAKLLIPNGDIYQKFENDIDEKYKPEDISDTLNWIENEQPYSKKNFAKWLEENLSANNISIDDLEITHKSLPNLYDKFVDFADEIANNNIHNNNLYSDENFKEWVKDNLASNNLTASELANNVAKEFQIQKSEKLELMSNADVYQKFKNNTDEKYKPKEVLDALDWIENEQPYSEENFAKWLEENLSANNINIDDLEITYKSLPDLYDKFVDEVNENESLLNENNNPYKNPYSNENFEKWIKDNLASNNLTVSELANSVAKEFKIQETKRKEEISCYDYSVSKTTGVKR